MEAGIQQYLALQAEFEPQLQASEPYFRQQRNAALPPKAGRRLISQGIHLFAGRVVLLKALLIGPTVQISAVVSAQAVHPGLTYAADVSAAYVVRVFLDGSPAAGRRRLGSSVSASPFTVS